MTQAPNKYLVPWSGGVDSTMALVEALKSSMQDHVRVISFEVNQTPKFQRDNERRAREALTKHLREKRCFKFESTTIKVGSKGPGFGGYCPQPVMWIGLTAAACRRDEIPVFGWLKTDYPPDMITDLLAAWRHLAKVNGAAEDPWTPFINQPKSEVQQQAHDYGLLKYCWSCEASEGEDKTPCGRCDSCISYQTGEFERRLRKRVTRISLPTKKAAKKKRRKK